MRRIVTIAYVVGLHLLLAVLVFKTDFLTRAGKTLGWLPPEERTVALYESLQVIQRRSLTVPDGSVIVLGDSIMAGLDENAIGPDVRIFAIGGLTSVTLREFMSTLPPLRSARAVILGIGTNDLKYRPKADIIRDQEILIAQFPAAQPIIVLATLPVRESNQAVQGRAYLRNADIAAMNVGLREICARRPHCYFVPTREAMADASGNLREHFQGGDGWHLSALGSQHLAALIRQTLDQVTRDPLMGDQVRPAIGERTGRRP